MLLTKYDKKLHMKTIYRQGYEEGHEEGYEEGYREGLEEARKRINQLNNALIEDERIDDLMKSWEDRAFREKLFREYNL